MNKGNRYEGIDPYVVKLIKHKAQKLIGKAGFLASDLEDIEQDLMADLHHRLHKFDSTKAQLHTFCSRVVDHRIATMFVERKNDDRVSSLNDKLTGGSIENNDGESVELIDVVNEDEYLLRTGNWKGPLEERIVRSIDIGRILSTLPPELRDLCRLLAIKNIKEISEQGSRSRASLYRDIQKLRAIFEAADLKDYL